MDYTSFIEGSKTKIIAPAGHGKTTAIAECIKQSRGTQLILTHTNAGIASIREKILKDKHIDSKSYNIETIMGYAQKYVKAFCNDVIKEEDPNYYNCLITNATKLFSLDLIKQIVSSTYNGIFIDEYQDCTKEQHNMLMQLSDVLPIHILGDPLQGIFEFDKSDLVNFESDLTNFQSFPSLNIPWRWQNAGNVALGNTLALIRRDLENTQMIDLSKYISDISIHYIGDEIYKFDYDNYLSKIVKVIKNLKTESILIIVPTYYEGIRLRGLIDDRKTIKQRIDYENKYILIEAIDTKDFYDMAKNIDVLISVKNGFKELKNKILNKLFPISHIDCWFNENGIKKKKDKIEFQKTENLRFLIEQFESNYSVLLTIYNILIEIRKGLKLKCYRIELFNAIIKSLYDAHYQKILVYDAMIQNRNIIRRVGKKIYGKCIGTTLLTKGLEFDTVIVLDAHNFSSIQHFYVAITRCCKQLIIFTKEKIISFKK